MISLIMSFQHALWAVEPNHPATGLQQKMTHILTRRLTETWPTDRPWYKLDHLKDTVGNMRNCLDSPRQVMINKSRLLHCFSCKTLTVIENAGPSADQKRKVGPITQAIQWYMDGHVAKSVEHRNFRRRVEQPDKAFDNFLAALWKLAKISNYCWDECTQKTICDQKDGDTIENLLQVKDLMQQSQNFKAKRPHSGVCV